MLENIKLLLGIPEDDSKDGVLEYLITVCSEEFKDLTHQEEIVESVVAQMVVCRYNIMGAEMLNIENYSGIMYNYKEDYPAYIQKQIISHRKLRVI